MGAASVIPGQSLSSARQLAPYIFDNPQPSLTESRHTGGAEIGDASQGFLSKIWTLTTDGTAVTISAPSVAPVVVFSGAGITEVSLAFDQGMNPTIAFVDGTGAKLRWFDSLISDYTITTLPAGSETPRVCLDDIRETQQAASDIILAYVRGGSLYFRAQRDRFGVEYPLASGLATKLRSVNMNTGLRLQFELGGTPA